MENLGLVHAKQQAYKDVYIPPGLRGKIKIDSKNLKVSAMEEINTKEFEDSKKIDRYYIYELVKNFHNDAELGKEIRKHVNANITKK
jgi:hypothetical protein